MAQKTSKTATTIEAKISSVDKKKISDMSRQFKNESRIYFYFPRGIFAIHQKISAKQHIASLIDKGEGRARRYFRQAVMFYSIDNQVLRVYFQRSSLSLRTVRIF